MPGATITTEGVTKDDPNRTTGSWNQTAGSAKEFVGGLVGNEVCVLTNKALQYQLETNPVPHRA